MRMFWLLLLRIPTHCTLSPETDPEVRTSIGGPYEFPAEAAWLDVAKHARVFLVVHGDCRQAHPARAYAERRARGDIAPKASSVGTCGLQAAQEMPEKSIPCSPRGDRHWYSIAGSR